MIYKTILRWNSSFENSNVVKICIHKYISLSIIIFTTITVHMKICNICARLALTNMTSCGAVKAMLSARTLLWIYNLSCIYMQLNITILLELVVYQYRLEIEKKVNAAFLKFKSFLNLLMICDLPIENGLDVVSQLLNACRKNICLHVSLPMCFFDIPNLAIFWS